MGKPTSYHHGTEQEDKPWFAALLLGAMLMVFLVIFLWDARPPGPPEKGIQPLRIENAPSATQLRKRTWPRTPQAVESAQPDNWYVPEAEAAPVEGEGDVETEAAEV